MDGPLEAYLWHELDAAGLVGFDVGTFDNGMRQIATATRPIVTPDDLVGLRIRVPAGQIFADTFRALGAEPITVNSDGIYAAFKKGQVDAQENPLAVLDLFRLYEVVRYVSLTNHMWSGFNLLANRATWTRLPAELTRTIRRQVARAVALQRRDQAALNARLATDLQRRGLVFNRVDAAPFRRRLSDVYTTWRERLGRRCWALLEEAVGPLG